MTPRHPPYALTCLATRIHGQKARDPEEDTVTIRLSERVGTRSDTARKCRRCPEGPRLHLGETQFRCHLDFFRLSKITTATRDRARNCERNTVSAGQAGVNSANPFFDRIHVIGDDRARTDNLRLARAALSQLSYVPSERSRQVPRTDFGKTVAGATEARRSVR